ncbi:phage baseplate protein, partial [Acinetobacter baumannii]
MAITETVGSLLFGGHRSIMGLFADVVIEENHSDELVITEHPVEKGS